MPNRFQRNSIGELVCRVPLNRGSLLKSIQNLVKTIETSENAVMIPTLLRDKVRVDAWELLFVAKILKASILGHDDLVEFYMNHIHQNSLSAAQTPTQGPPTSQLTPNGGEPALSPSLARQQSSPSMASPRIVHHATNGNTNNNTTANNVLIKDPQDQTPTTANSHHSFTSSNHSSQASSTIATTTGGGGHNNQTTGQATAKSSSTSWMTASQHQSSGGSLTSGSPFGSSACSTTSTTSSSANVTATTATNCEPVASTTAVSSVDTNGAGQTNLATPLKLAPDEPNEGLLAARPLMARLAQPPSLLQLTTTNNHINSVSEMLNSSPLDPSLDLLSQHLISLQQQQQQAQFAQPNSLELGSGLSLSISTNGQTNGLGATDQQQAHSSHHLLPNSTNLTLNQQQQQPAMARHELRSSRSAGCLFRANSGASSPRTPGTPYPQAETLAGSANQNGLVGDPTSLVKLLLQVEQLKASIVHVNTLLESVVELYKKSIDNISQ